MLALQGLACLLVMQSLGELLSRGLQLPFPGPVIGMVLLVLGLLISIPLVVFGSTLMIKLMERFPIIVILGAALIGWVAGETILGDRSLEAVVAANGWLHYVGPLAGAAFVIVVGKFLQNRTGKTATS